MQTTGDIGLYFHIPFCKKKCPYCRFYSISPNENLQKMLFISFMEEIKKIPKNKKIASIYFGGGTPSLFEKKYLFKILETISKTTNCKTTNCNLTNCEITIEINPEDVSKEKIKDFKNMGINRISIGIQSFDNFILKILQRSHDEKKSIKAIEDIYNSKIQNISCDIMYDIPYQKYTHFNNTLKTLIKLPINHVSIYNLTFEKNTPFYKKKKFLKKFIPSEEESLKCFKKGISFLKHKGFHHYEISAFGKKGYFSSHNLRYWLGKDFLGFGPSAFSYFKKNRFQNISNIYKYYQAIKNKKSPISYSEKLKYPKNIKELFVINLRVLKGVNLEKFKKMPEDMKKTIDKLIKEKFLIKKEKKIKLSKKGILFYDEIASILI